MAIRDLLQIRNRTLVACIGEVPTENNLAEFINRHLSVEAATEDNLQNPTYLSAVSTVVFTQQVEKLRLLPTLLRKHARFLLDHDCVVIVRIAQSKVHNCRSIVIQEIGNLKLPTTGLTSEDTNGVTTDEVGSGSPLLPHISLFGSATTWKDVAQAIIATPPDQGPNLSLEINVKDEDKLRDEQKLRSDERLLIQRAFSDCNKVYLESLDDGRSNAKVYLAHIFLTQPHIPDAWLTPRFVKIDSRKQIFTEYTNYKDNVDPYIPFNLGPNLDKERCCLGAKKGILVGDFIEESESLNNCASQNRAISAIACLFNKTLHGWYHAAKPEDIPLTKSLSFPFFRCVKTDARINRAFQLGATKSPKELNDLFNQCSTELPVLVGPTHGDLHAKNIRVRETESILIDFCAYKTRPLVYDAAFLEASLLVDGFINGAVAPQLLIDSIKPLYLNVHSEHHHRPKIPNDQTKWFYACVRQIRLHGKQMELTKKQYAAALSVALLLKASKDLDAIEPESSIRAVAYFLAETVLVSTFGK